MKCGSSKQAVEKSCNRGPALPHVRARSDEHESGKRLACTQLLAQIRSPSSQNKHGFDITDHWQQHSAGQRARCLNIAPCAVKTLRISTARRGKSIFIMRFGYSVPMFFPSLRANPVSFERKAWPFFAGNQILTFPAPPRNLTYLSAPSFSMLRARHA